MHGGCQVFRAHAARSMQQEAYNPKHAARNMRQEARIMKHAARSTQHEARSTKHAARSTKHEACTAGARSPASMCTMQHWVRAAAARASHRN